MSWAALVLAVHLLVIAFNLGGLLAIPIGAALGWRFVRGRGWRAVHVASWAVVAIQALLGRACFLTVWQDQLTGGRGEASPMVMGLVNRLIFWPLPMWAFALAYAVLFAAVLALWRLVPPQRR